MKEEKVPSKGIRKSAWCTILLVALLAGAASLNAFKKNGSAGDSAAQESASINQQTPRPAESVANAPGGSAARNQPGVQGSQTRTTDAQTTAARSAAARQDTSPEADLAPQGSPAREEHPSAERSLLPAQLSQRQKDRLSATRAPVAFAGGEPRSPDPTLPRENAPQALQAPELTGVNRVFDRMADNMGAPGADSDDQNRQGEKRGFVRENRSDFPYLKGTLLTPISRYEVKAGSIIPGVLLTGINSDLPGQITAQVRENVYDTVSGRFLLVPQGTRLIGEYDSKICYGQERVLVVWTRLIMPNGNSIGLEGMPGIDLSGYAGVGGRVNNHYGKLVTGVVLGSMIGAGAQVAAGGQGSPNVPPSFPQLFVSGAAGNINQAGQQITQKNLNLQPTIEVAPGQRINIFLTKDLILRPYTE